MVSYADCFHPSLPASDISGNLRLARSRLGLAVTPVRNAMRNGRSITESMVAVSNAVYQQSINPPTANTAMLAGASLLYSTWPGPWMLLTIDQHDLSSICTSAKISAGSVNMSAHTPRKQRVSAAANTASPSSSATNGELAKAKTAGGASSNNNKRRGARSSSSSSRSLMRWASLIPIGVVLYFFVGWLESIKQNHYVFDPQRLHALVQDSLATTRSLNSTDAIFDEILRRLNEDPRIAPTLNKQPWRDEKEWMFNNAGGAMGAMYLLHASVTEYLIFFGTPIGTEGHTGRHTADDYFHILTGEQHAYSAGALKAEIYRPGDQHHLRRGEAKQYMMPEGGCWALELAQGWIPPMMPFGLADTLFSTLDAPSFGRTVWITAREMLGNLAIGKF
ncbi:unnamed protein product [Tilletia controversa]|nr:unnamed protein product [Tilletia controversa]